VTKGYLAVGGQVQYTIMAIIVLAAMIYQNTHAWIARGGETRDEVFAPAPPFFGHKELTAEEDQVEREVHL
jgi:hypothetical protein